jgi:nicotinamidase-related amidase
MSEMYRVIRPADSVLLMVDHQSGLRQVVNDLSVREVRTQVAALTRAATPARLPVIAVRAVNAHT